MSTRSEESTDARSSGSLTHVFLRRWISADESAARTASSPLKFFSTMNCSATSTKYARAAARLAIFGCFRISVTTHRETRLKSEIMRAMNGAPAPSPFDHLSPKHSDGPMAT
eukprot:Amastigsp_a180018_20.p3 type:complete len:112 gc:universal Amastigsp_a180018_20:442-107(-)